MAQNAGFYKTVPKAAGFIFAEAADKKCIWKFAD